MPNDMINALLGQQTEMPQQPSPFGVEPPRPEDAISNLYRSNTPKSSWLGGAAKGGELEMGAPDTVDKILGTLSRFTPGPSDRGLPRPPEEGFWEGFKKQGILPAALMGARASGVRLTPSAQPGRDPTLQLRGRYTRLQDHGAYMNHPAIGKWPFIASSQLAANLYGRDEVPEDSAPAIEHPSPHNNVPATASNQFTERWGEMAPPRQEMPPPESLALQSGRFMPQPGGFPAMPPTSVPMPRPNPLPPKDFINPILMTKPYPKKREADAFKDQPQHDWRRSGMMHMEQGGYNPGQPMVVGENGPEVVVPHGPATVIPNNIAKQPVEDLKKALKLQTKAAFPNAYSLFSGEPQAPLQDLPTQPGKVPQANYDRRAPAAAQEFAETAVNALPFALMGPAGGVARGARGAAGALDAGGVSAASKAMNPGFGGAAGLAAEAMLDPNTAEAQKMNSTTRQQLILQKAEQAAAAAETQRQREFQAQQDVIKNQNEQAKIKLQSDEAIRLAKEQQDRADAAAEKERVRLAKATQDELDKSYRLKNPGLSNALSMGGLAGAAVLPYAGRAVKAWNANRPFAQWESKIAKAEEALSAGDIEKAKVFGAEAAGIKKDIAASAKKAANKTPMQELGSKAMNAGFYGASGLLPIEAGMTPEWFDLRYGTPKAKENAWGEVPNQAMVGGAQGLTAMALGSKAPLPIKQRGPLNSQTNDLVKALKAFKAKK